VVSYLLACSVCWGAVQDPVVEGTKLSIVFLLGLTYLLLGGGVGLVFVVRRKALRAAAADGARGASSSAATTTTASPGADDRALVSPHSR
jgi:hypothetical protein